MELVVRSAHGLEWVCASEAAVVYQTSALALSRREVSFAAELDDRVRALSCADDAFLVVGRLSDIGSTKAALPALADGLAALDWSAALSALHSFRTLPDRPAYDCTASLEGRRTYNRYAVESCAAGLPWGEFLPRTGAGLAGTPDVTVRLFLRGDEAVAALRVLDRPLHRRPWKLDAGPGTLHPPVAAALAWLASPPAGRVLDPYCGDGTIAIETALAWPAVAVRASDLDPARVAATTANADRAYAMVDTGVADALSTAGPYDAVLTNPPWDLAVSSAGRLDDFWPHAADLAPVLCCLVDASLPGPLEHGWTVTLQQRLRLAGREVHLTLAAPPGAPAPTLRPDLAAWRDLAISSGVVTSDGF